MSLNTTVGGSVNQAPTSGAKAISITETDNAIGEGTKELRTIMKEQNTGLNRMAIEVKNPKTLIATTRSEKVKHAIGKVVEAMEVLEDNKLRLYRSMNVFARKV